MRMACGGAAGSDSCASGGTWGTGKADELRNIGDPNLSAVADVEAVCMVKSAAIQSAAGQYAFDDAVYSRIAERCCLDRTGTSWNLNSQPPTCECPSGQTWNAATTRCEPCPDIPITLRDSYTSNYYGGGTVTVSQGVDAAIPFGSAHAQYIDPANCVVEVSLGQSVPAMIAGDGVAICNVKIDVGLPPPVSILNVSCDVTDAGYPMPGPLCTSSPSSMSGWSTVSMTFTFQSIEIASTEPATTQRPHCRVRLQANSVLFG
jgi:hypothetical protein